PKLLSGLANRPKSLDRICKVLQKILQISCKLPEVSDSSAGLPTSGDRPFDSGLSSLRFHIVRSTSARGQCAMRASNFSQTAFSASSKTGSIASLTIRSSAQVRKYANEHEPLPQWAVGKMAKPAFAQEGRKAREQNSQQKMAQTHLAKC